jgi:ABC-type cobalt transport system substrate-binding protein
VGETIERGDWMRKVTLILLGLILSVTFLGWALSRTSSSWSGVDETVVERFAEKAGRKAGEPLINTDQGDLLLFVFLIAGAAGGFIAGYSFRGLFPPSGGDKGS